MKNYSILQDSILICFNLMHILHNPKMVILNAIKSTDRNEKVTNV